MSITYKLARNDKGGLLKKGACHQNSLKYSLQLHEYPVRPLLLQGPMYFYKLFVNSMGDRHQIGKFGICC